MIRNCGEMVNMKVFNKMVLSRNTNFILQSHSIQNILEQIYRLADLTQELRNEAIHNEAETKTDKKWLEILDLLSDFKLLREFHIKQVARIASMGTLRDLLEDTSTKFRSKMLNDVFIYQEAHNMDLERKLEECENDWT